VYELVPFEDPAFGLQGLVPAGWTGLGSGLWARAESATDTTILAIQAAPLTAEVLWPTLLPQFLLDEVPEPTGESASNGFNWTLHQFDVTNAGVTVAIDLALSDYVNGQTAVVLLQAPEAEYAALHDAVFTPVLAAVAPFSPPDADELPYVAEEVTFPSGDVTLSGTLTMPPGDGPFPAVVLMTGSGPQTRDEIVVPGFGIFSVLAEALTSNGMAVLRYDDRGVGKSGGEYLTASIDDFAADGLAAVDYLTGRAEIRRDQIGLLGHSEGGYYAGKIMAAQQENLSFAILMAGPAVAGLDVLLVQNEMLLDAAEASEAFIALQLQMIQDIMAPLQAGDLDRVQEIVYDTAVQQWDSMSEEEQASMGVSDGETFARLSVDQFISGYANASFTSMLAYDPAADFQAADVPVLAIFGGKDIQVDATSSTDALAALDLDPDLWTIVTLPDANHLFQAAETGNVDEYATLPFEFTAEFIPTILNWLAGVVDLPG
jgi:pimeloyl-ACP methyl ester carboxylesterase